jgi:hypothetical protein
MLMHITILLNRYPLWGEGGSIGKLDSADVRFMMSIDNKQPGRQEAI